MKQTELPFYETYEDPETPCTVLETVVVEDHTYELGRAVDITASSLTMQYYYSRDDKQKFWFATLTQARKALVDDIDREYGDRYFAYKIDIGASDDDDGYYTAKTDKGKPRFDLVPYTALREVAKILGGALKENGGKYEAHSWKSIPDAPRRYYRALLDHAFKMEEMGLDAVDAESGELHAAHAATNALFLVYLILQNK